MNNVSILRRVVEVIFATGSIATTAPAAQFIETNGQVVVEAEHYTSKTDGTNHALGEHCSRLPHRPVPGQMCPLPAHTRPPWINRGVSTV